MRRVIGGGAAIGLGALTALGACGAFGEGKDDTLTPAIDAGGSETGMSPDGAAADARPNDGSPPVTCIDGAFWCEHFENGLGAWTTPPAGVDTVLGPGSARAKALHVRAPAGGSQHTIERPIAGPPSTVLLSGWLYVRPVLYSNEDDNSNYAVAAIKDDATDTFVALYLWRGSVPGEATVQLTGASVPKPFLGTSPSSMTYDAWHHIEIRVTFGASGRMEWKLDGKEIASELFPTNLPAGLVAMLGVRRTNDATPVVELFIDDVMASN